MRYTEALEEIYKDRSKVFYGVGRWNEVYRLKGSDHGIVMEYTEIDESVSFLSYWMMETDWTEEAE